MQHRRRASAADAESRAKNKVCFCCFADQFSSCIYPLLFEKVFFLFRNEQFPIVKYE
jgi:hypothetical protein